MIHIWYAIFNTSALKMNAQLIYQESMQKSNNLYAIA